MLNFHLTFLFPCIKIFVQYIKIDFCVSNTTVPSTGNLTLNKIVLKKLTFMWGNRKI